MKEYTKKLLKLIKIVEKVNKKTIDEAALLIANSLTNNGLIYMFGCGHSSLIASDCFYRAGGLASVAPIYKDELMLHVSASNSSKLEKDETNAKGLLDDIIFTNNDIMVVISVSGKNGVPIEVARQAKEKGIKVIVLTSSSYFDENSRHSSGKLLKDFGDVILDNKVPKGDAIINYSNGLKAIPVSTSVSSYLLQLTLSEAIRKLIKDNKEVDVFQSGNLNKNIQGNNELIEKYKDRVKYL